jgi:hypothetical protein
MNECSAYIHAMLTGHWLVAVGLAALIIFVCMLGRACFVFPLIHLHNKWRPENVKIREMVVIW